MKLYLSSYKGGSNPTTLKTLVGHPGRAALIFNALDSHDTERLKHIDQEFNEIGSLGFHCDELDLRSYFGNGDGLRARLENYDLVWVVGGNTFVLARAMQQSRFAEAISELLAANNIVYGGYSAGACVTGPDLIGCHLMDEPDVLPSGYQPNVAPNPLGWVPWRIIPHWKSDHPEAPLADLAVECLLESGLPFQTLRDGQAYIVDGDDHRLV